MALDFFASDMAHDAVREKVAFLFPEHEIEQFTAHFWGLIELWRRTERDRLARSSAGGEAEA